MKPNWKSMPACSTATVTRAANLQDGRRGGLNTVLRAPAVVPALLRTGPPEVRGAAGAAQVDVVYAFTDSMCLLEQLTCRSTKAEALYGERVTSPID